MRKPLKEQWSRLAFGKRNTSINESVQGQDEFQTIVYELLTTLPPDKAKNVGWLLTLEEHALRNILVDMNLATMGKNGTVEIGVPDTYGQGNFNKQRGERIAVGRMQWYVDNPDVVLQMLQRAQIEEPRAYASLQKQFYKAAAKWGLI